MKNILSKRTARVKLIGRLSAVLILTLGVAIGTVTDTFAAATPSTVSIDPLPTVQIDGIVWKQAIYGDTVYATGKFSSARPAGADPGQRTVKRTNLLAYDITTGNLIDDFDIPLTGNDAQGRGIAVSPDGSRLYVGGKFSQADGKDHTNFVAIDLKTKKVLDGFRGTDASVKAVAATNDRVYIGGIFNKAGGETRTKLAAYKASGEIDKSWVANVTGYSVSALVTVPSAGNLIVGGSFSKISDYTYYSNGAVKLTTGKNVTPWASHSSSFRIRMQAPKGASPSQLGITSLSTDNEQVYLTAFTYITDVEHPGSFEGRAALNPKNGKLIWANDCYGDSYDAFPIGDVLYSVSHAHNCKAAHGFRDINPHPKRAMAETTYKTCKNVKGNGTRHPSFKGVPCSKILSWFPTLNTGDKSGSGQAAWSVVGNSKYVALGGEFTKAEGRKQQGLVRYAVHSIAPNNYGPKAYTKNGVKAAKANSKGKSKVTITATSDRDDSILTYKVYRGDETKPRVTKKVSSRFWKTTTWSFTDTGVKKGKTAKYRVVVTDSSGNKVETHN